MTIRQSINQTLVAYETKAFNVRFSGPGSPGYIAVNNNPNDLYVSRNFALESRTAPGSEFGFYFYTRLYHEPFKRYVDEIFHYHDICFSEAIFTE